MQLILKIKFLFIAVLVFYPHYPSFTELMKNKHSNKQKKRKQNKNGLLLHN